MLKRSLVTMCVVGLMTTGAMAEAIIQYDTGHPDGPHFLEVDPDTGLGVPTIMTISVQDSTGSDWGIGSVIFDFAGSDANLSWDLDGPDDTQFTADDGFVWQNGLDDLVNDYFATVDPPQSVWLGQTINWMDAVRVFANGKTIMATLEITGNGLVGDELKFVVGQPGTLVIDAETFISRVIKDGTEQVTLTLVPEPATLLLMGIGGFCALRRRR